MRALIQPTVVRKAAAWAGLTTLAAWPRLALWSSAPAAVWFLCLVLGLVSWVLWAFVWAWYVPGTGAAVWRWRLPACEWLSAGAAGLACASLLALFVDPVLREIRPADYPVNWSGWGAGLLFALGFSQLFTCFAPYAFFLRLTRVRGVAMGLTVGFGVFLLGLQVRELVMPLTTEFLIGVVAVRAVFGWIAVWLFVRGGLGLTWAWDLMVQVRLVWPLL